MNNFFKELVRHFEVTPINVIKEEWAKSAVYDSVGPTVEEFLTNPQQYYRYSPAPDILCTENIKNQKNPKFSSGFFIKLAYCSHEYLRSQ